ncbi:MAG: hypothetical protein J6B79_00205 [Clostridia bacterium]|nr:hypothetical protein [Clostridia bacterium]
MKDKAFQSAIDIVRTGDTITMSDLIKQGYSCTQSLKAMKELLDKGIIKDAGEGVFAVVADEEDIDQVAVIGGAIKRKLTAQKLDEVVELLDAKSVDALKRIFQHERTWGTGVTAEENDYLIQSYNALVSLGLATKNEDKFVCTLREEDYEELVAKYRDYATQLRMERIKKRREEFERAQKQKNNQVAEESAPTGLDAIRDEDDRKAIEEVLASVSEEKKPKSDFDALEEQIKRLREKKAENPNVVFFAQMSNGTDKVRIGVEKQDKLIDLIRRTAKAGGNSTLMKIVGGSANLIKLISPDNKEKDKCGTFFLQAQDVKIALNWSVSVFEQCKQKLGEVLSKDENASVEIVFYKA